MAIVFELSLSVARLLRSGADGLDLLALAHEILALHDQARAVGKPADPHEGLIVLDDRDRDRIRRCPPH